MGKVYHDLSIELSVRIDACEKWKKYRKCCQIWTKLPESKLAAFERQHELS